MKPGAAISSTRIALIVAGVAGLAWGVVVLFDTVNVARIPGVALWIGAAIVVHDAVLAPVVFGCGLLLRRAGRRVAGTIVVVVQGAIVLGSLLSLVVVPEIIADRLGARNPTVLPLDYGLNLALFWLVTGLLAAGVSLMFYARSRLAKQRPSSRQS